jgi:HK97 family phage major capsid protein
LKTIEELKQRLADLQASAKSIQDKADVEKRDLNDEESQQLETIFADFENTEADIKRRERIAAQEAKLSATAGRRTSPEALKNGKKEDEQEPAVGSRVWVPPTNKNERDRWGWKSLGDFSNAVRDACVPNGKVDPRLQNAPTTYGSEGIGPDGGFALPPEFRAEIMQKVAGEDQLIARCDQNPISGNSLTVPKDETTPWGSAGVQAYWDGEAASYTQKKPTLESSTIKVHKLTALVPVTDELLEDAPAMGSYILRKAPEVMQFKVTDAIVNGTGAGMPLGLLNSPCVVSVAKETSQVAATVVGENVLKMFSRMYAPWRNSAVWLVNQDIEPQLGQLNIKIKNVAGTENVGGHPVYVPPGGLSAAPFGTLLGRQIVPIQSCSTLGTVGDIIFASMGQYAAVLKSGGIKADSSIHLFFDYGLTAFRFTFRMGGQPWWSAPISPKNGSNTLAPFVTLATRA